MPLTILYAAIPNSFSTNFICATVSPFATRLALPFLIMSIASIPRSVLQAVRTDPYPLASHVRRFTFLWLHCRKRQLRRMVPSCFNSSTAGGYARFLSTLMTRGGRLPGRAKALRKKRFAAAASRLEVRRKSMVCPVESTAR